MRGDPTSLRDAWLDLDGRRLLYRTNADANPPDDAPVLIHVHGFAISGRYLMPTAFRLARDFRTFVPDLPGFGRSERPPRPFDIPQLADALAGFMDAVGVERATLLGNSLGCPIIGEFLDHFPDRVERVIFVSPAGGLYNQPLPKGLSQLIVDTLREPPGMAKYVVSDYLHYGPVATFNLIRSMLAYPTTERIAELTIPTLVVLGSRDPFVSERWVKRRAAGLPHVTALTIHGAAHAINFSHPEQLANVVRRWMADQPIEDDPTLPGRARVFLRPAAD
ncbi:MAG TPA: alpha/beta hydrolase [Candidatus Limnocylindria bacterium]|nr:alpha/beta hydrolase [Candidatus Limnocylindria bacterium]